MSGQIIGGVDIERIHAHLGPLAHDVVKHLQSHVSNLQDALQTVLESPICDDHETNMFFTFGVPITAPSCRYKAEQLLKQVKEDKTYA